MHCDPTTQDTAVLGCFCMTTDRSGENTVVGACLFTCRDYPIYLVPRNASELDQSVCGHVHRTGQLCGQCQEGYAPPVYSYYLGCVPCSHGETNIAKYLLVSFLPLTVFVIVVLVAGIRATSPRLNAFIFVCHVLGSPVAQRLATAQLQQYPSVVLYGLYIGGSVMGIWSLDFFRMVYHPFCLHHGMNTLQVLSMDYITAIYPMVLMVLIFLLVKLYDHKLRVISYLCIPLQWCTSCCKGKWNVRTSLIDTFATFLVLSCAKLLSVSADLLIPTELCDIHGRTERQLFLYYDATIEYFGEEHRLYGILAITVLALFIFFPTVLLFLYPCRCFQRVLNRCQVRGFVLHTFMDNFLGCYKDGTNGTRDCRYFAGMYIGVRMLILLIFALCVGVITYTVEIVCLLLFTALLVIVRPHKNDVFNNLDALLIFGVTIVFVAILSTAAITADVYWFTAVVIVYGAAIPIVAYPIVVLSHRIFRQAGVRWHSCYKLRNVVSKLLRLSTSIEESLPDRVVNAGRYIPQLEPELYTPSTDSDEDMLIPSS